MKPQDKRRLDKIKEEFRAGFDYLSEIKKGIVIFGSARTSSADKYYKKAEELAYKLAKKGFSIITGAGKGIMEAGNKGAYLANGVSVGLNIDLPDHQQKNKYITHYIKFKHFYTRKVMFAKYSFASIVFPGGYGTIDELFEQLIILQNQKISQRPVIIVGENYYKGLINWLINKVRLDKKISEKDLNLFIVTDNVNKMIKIVEEEYNRSRRFFI